MSMKKTHLILIIIFVAAIVSVIMVNYTGKKKDTKPEIIGDRQVRIVSLAPNVTEILFALGFDEEIVAVSNNSDYPAQAAEKKKVGTFWQPNTEQIIASRPSLIITLWFEQQRAVAQVLERLGYEVLVLRLETIAEFFEAIEKTGEKTGRKDRAENLVKKIKNGFAEMQSKYSSAEKIKVLWVVQTEPLRLAGRNTFVNELIELVGGENAIGSTIQQYPSVSTEELLTCGAEVIIHSAMDKNNIEKERIAAKKFWSKWQNIPAVKNNRVYIVEDDTILRLGPRLLEGVELIARCLHPNDLSQIEANK